MNPLPNHLREIRERLLQAYHVDGMWDVVNPAAILPKNVTRGSDEHLIFLTLVYTISGGREPVQLWESARKTLAEDAELFSPQFLAYTKPAHITARLNQYGLTKKATSEAVIWQKIGQALMMRANGSVQKLLKNHDFDAPKLMHMLAESKTTFPILSGAQTAPRWLYGLSSIGKQPIKHAQDLPVPLSPHAQKALDNLNIQANKLSAQSFDAVDALGRHGCRQRKPTQAICPAANACPVAAFCQHG